MRRKERLGPDRLTGMIRGGRVRQRRLPRLFKNKWAMTGIVVLLVVVGVAAWSAWVFFSTQAGIQDGPDLGNRSGAPKPEGEPELVLLVGSDSREGLTPQEKIDLGADDVDGERADTLILAQIDPVTDHITMVQFPRDLWVSVGNEKNKINAALEQGDEALVKTVEDLTGLEIDRSVQINIAGFKDLVDAIGGVDVCIPEPIEFDPNTGLEIPEAGIVHFSGRKAVRFVRSRHSVEGGDLGRIQNQQKFMAAAIDKITSVDTLLHLSRIQELQEVLKKNIKVDQSTGLLDLLRIGQRFRAFDPGRFEAYTAPNLGIGESASGLSIVVPDMPAMRVMFEALAREESPAEADRVPDVDPDLVSVGVYNGTYRDGAAAAAERALEKAVRTSQGSLTVAEVANAERFNYKETEIVYSEAEPDAARMAKLVSAAIPGIKV
ncbi:MAG: LCP family protein, partial [Actinomycetota bacterium]|nr:LCP family protein [Actinomycetota bacterium]